MFCLTDKHHQIEHVYAAKKEEEKKNSTVGRGEKELVNQPVLVMNEKKLGAPQSRCLI